MISIRQKNGLSRKQKNAHWTTKELLSKSWHTDTKSDESKRFWAGTHDNVKFYFLRVLIWFKFTSGLKKY